MRVLVVGAGIVGTVIAYEMAKRGAEVLILERGDRCREASWASAGMVSQSLPANDPLGRLHAEGSRLFPQFAAEVADLTGVDTSYRCNGGYRLCAAGDGVDAWRDRFDALRSAGCPCEWIDGVDLPKREPALVHGLPGGIYLPNDGVVDPRRYCDVVALAASRHGAEFRTGCAVIDLLRRGDRVTGVMTASGPMEGDLVVLALGAWTEEASRWIGVRLPMRPARGQIVRLEALPPMLRSTVHCGDFYLTARPDGTILAGSTVEFVGFEKRVTPNGLKTLIDQALAIAPSLGSARVVDQWSGLRPYPERELPYLGPVPGLEGIFVAAGHFRTGISPSPITGRLVAEWAYGEETSLPLGAFALPA